MKYFLSLAIGLCITAIVTAQPAQWKIVDEKIKTKWADEVDPARALPEYPRPQMVRDVWMNLNGLWSYAITPDGQKQPARYEDQILVPFAVESALSGVGRRVGKDNRLWYKRSFTPPKSFRGKRVLLHFGAVDWRCEVFVNGTSAGAHEGGYDPFYFDITALLKGNGQQELVVSVWDPSNDGPQPRGKQVKEPNSIWYTPVTGIWQTVWIEAVNDSHLEALRFTPDPDRRQLHASVKARNMKGGDVVRVTVSSDGAQVARQESTTPELTLTFTDIKWWSPSSPHLYDVSVALVRKGKVIDEVKSYAAMRKVSMKKDATGTQRMYLNNEFVFQYGPLDQGWWPDGLYTAPTDEALKFDIEKTKVMGFNMIRKHVKVEPSRWYYHCDKLGILVWQDMPSGDMGNRWDSRPGILGIATEKERSAQSEAIFRKEWKAIMDATYHFPSIVVWVPFNEAWGQFKTEEIVNWTVAYDSSRLVNGASGGNFTTAGHIIDLHNYPAPAMPDPALFGKDQIVVLGEFGGLGLPLEGHTWQGKDNWGYQSFNNAQELTAKYAEFMNSVKDLIGKGLSAAVYTQTTDVEIEVNGLMTYDRAIIKMPAEKLYTLHQDLYKVKIR